MKTKMRNVIAIFALVFATAFAVAACTDDVVTPPPTPETYAVTYDLGGGTGTLPTGGSYEAGATFALASSNGLTKDGFTFDKWNDGTTDYAAGATYTMPAHAVTFTAKWIADEQPAPETYVVTYDLGGGTGNLPAGGSYEAGATFALASSNGLTKDGFTFDKWNDGTTDYAAGATYTMPAHAVTFTAKWKADEQPAPETYAVTYDLGGGTGNLPAGGSYEAGATFALASSNGLTKDGFTFDKWNDGTTDYAAGATYTMPAHAVTFTAKWIADEQPGEKTFGQQLAEYISNGTTPALNATPSVGDIGLISGSVNTGSNFAPTGSKGAVSDGQYLYISQGNSPKVVSRVDLSTWTVDATSASFTLTGNSDNGKLFIKDGVLYCVGRKVFSISLAEFANGCAFTENVEMKNLLSQNGAHNVLSAYYNVENDKYAVLDESGSAYVLNGDGTVDTEAYTCEYTAATGWAAASVCGDGNYYYVSYKKSAALNVPIHVYAWDGTYVCELNATGISVGHASANVQAIYMIDGKLHGCVATWAAATAVPWGFKDWTIEFDTTVSE